MYNNRFNEEMENEIKLGKKCVIISNHDKESSNGLANLESRTFSKTEENGEYSTFIGVKKGKRVMIGSGEHSSL